MRCSDIRDCLDTLWERGETPEIRRHLNDCPACSAYHRELRLLRAGFTLLKREPVVEPSLGFAERLVRQLNTAGRAPVLAEFFERGGRRFVLATLVFTFLCLLALVLPSTGPVRGLSAADLQMPAQEAMLAYSDPLGETALQGSPDRGTTAPPPAIRNEGK